MTQRYGLMALLAFVVTICLAVKANAAYEHAPALPHEPILSLIVFPGEYVKAFAADPPSSHLRSVDGLLPFHYAHFSLLKWNVSGTFTQPSNILQVVYALAVSHYPDNHTISRRHTTQLLAALALDAISSADVARHSLPAIAEMPHAAPFHDASPKGASIE
jgi:hypothetical protein